MMVQPDTARHALGAPASLAPLTWMLPDLRKSLPMAANAVRKFHTAVRYRALHKSDGADPENLQTALGLLRQARSALEMVQQNGAAKLLMASEGLAQSFLQSPQQCTEEAVQSMEMALRALLDYLEASAKGKPADALGLFPQYQALLRCAGAQRIHPADLSMPAWTLRAVPVPPQAQPQALTPRLRSKLGQALLRLLNGNDDAAADVLTTACAALAARAPQGELQSFWTLAAGLFEAYRHQCLVVDVFVKRTASQIVHHLHRGPADPDAIAQLAKDAAFFCLIAQPDPRLPMPFLTAVQEAYGGMPRPAGNYQQPRYGLVDPVQIELLRKRLAALSENWSALVGGDTVRSSVVLEQLTDVAQTLQALQPVSTGLLLALQQAIDIGVGAGDKASPVVAMEVATTLLYLEAVCDDTDPATEALQERMAVLSRRLHAVCEGQTPQALEPWMEALYRRLSARQSLGSVTSELQTTLVAVEAALEQYLRDPLDNQLLSVVSGHLSQISGVFSVLDVPQAVQAVFKVREILDLHLSGGHRARPIPLPTYEQIARSISTLGLLVDLLGYQVSMAKDLFIFDPEAGELRYLNGRGTRDQPLALAQSAVPMAPPDDGAEILDLFLNEAQGVLLDALQALPAPGSDHAAFENLLLLRRAFHTLKGGARMVGQEALGEAAWAFEQLLNHWVAAQKAVHADGLELVGQALRACLDWCQAIEEGQDGEWSPAPFRRAADAMRLTARRLPLQVARLQAGPQENAVPTGDMAVNPATPHGISEAVRGDAASPEQAASALPDTDDPASQPAALEVHTDHGVPMDQAPAPQSGPLDFPELVMTVFVTETSQWADQLLEQVCAWDGGATELSLRTVRDLAHSIRGNGAAVGLAPIAHLAQAMEETLDHLRLNPPSLAPHSLLFREAAQVLCSMVSQSALQGVPQPCEDLVARLKDLHRSSSVADTIAVDPPALTDAMDAALGPDPLHRVQTVSAALPLAALPLASDAVPALAQPAPFDWVEDDGALDSIDQLDLDLWPIFQEEGAELVAALGAALRLWCSQPGEATHRAQVLRLLHTLKGSGRLAGAFRLGELAHRMESAIERVPVPGLAAAKIEPFLVRWDQLQGIFQELGQTAQHHQPSDLPPADDSATPPAWLPGHRAWHAAAQAARPAMLSGLIRVRASLAERLLEQAGEVSVLRSRAETRLGQMTSALAELSQTLDRLSSHLRELELQADMRIQSRNNPATDTAQQFDPLEFDRFTRLQEIARTMVEAVGDVATVRRNVQTGLDASQQDLEQQARQLRHLQNDLLRMRLIAFDGIADRLYSVVRQSAKALDKQVSLDVEGGQIEVDRSVLERMTPAFEHLLRNAIVHGIEPATQRQALGKPSAGAIRVVVSQDGNDVAIEVTDDGQGLSIEQIHRKARSLGLVAENHQADRDTAIKLLFAPGFSTATEVTELAGRGIGLDVVLSEVHALGGRIETQFVQGQGTSFKLVLPLTTAVTQVVLFRAGRARFGIAAGLVENLIRATPAMLENAYAAGLLMTAEGQQTPFYGAGPLLHVTHDASDRKAKSQPVLILRSAGQSLALHVDEVLGNREVVVKNMGPQLSRLPGLAGITVLPSGETILIYNPIALANVYGEEVRIAQRLAQSAGEVALLPAQSSAPLILVVDDALTVRRVIQRLLLREGYRVALANDGVHALQLVEQQRPLMVLTDIEMPRMDGFELVRSIRAHPEYADLPIVMITSRIAQKHRDHAMALGVNHYLGKPYSEPELLGLIRDHAQTVGGHARPAPSLQV